MKVSFKAYLDEIDFAEEETRCPVLDEMGMPMATAKESEPFIAEPGCIFEPYSDDGAEAA